MNYELAQRGRALIDFEVGIRQAAHRMQTVVERALADRGVTADTLPESMEDRHAMVDSTLGDYLPYRTRALLGEWTAKEHGKVCEEAFEEIRESVAPMLDALAHGGTTIDDLPGEMPRYFSSAWFHRTTGGWDASDYNGFIHGELVHKRYVARIYPGDIYAQRRALLDQLPARSYGRILEFGTSSGHYTLALAERFPDAEIVGVDLSRRMLEQAQRVANERGLGWKLFVGAAEDTGFEDAGFDLVTSFAIHHELPPRIIKRWFEEAFRLLRPGGELLMADVQRYADLDRLTAWRFDWAAKWGGEPFWRSAAMVDFAEGATAAGFVDVRAEGVPPSGYPYFVYARKPADG